MRKFVSETCCFGGNYSLILHGRPLCVYVCMCGTDNMSKYNTVRVFKVFAMQLNTLLKLSSYFVFEKRPVLQLQ